MLSTAVVMIYYKESCIKSRTLIMEKTQRKINTDHRFKLTVDEDSVVSDTNLVGDVDVV
jgi:hypothetical protein